MHHNILSTDESATERSIGGRYTVTLKTDLCKDAYMIEKRASVFKTALRPFRSCPVQCLLSPRRPKIFSMISQSVTFRDVSGQPSFPFSLGVLCHGRKILIEPFEPD